MIGLGLGVATIGVGAVLYTKRDVILAKLAEKGFHIMAEAEVSGPDAGEGASDGATESSDEPQEPAAAPPPHPLLGTLSVARKDATQRLVASAPIPADERTYARYAGRQDVLVLVDYYADWCGPCRGIAPHLSRLAAAHGDKVVVLKVDVDRQKALAQRAGIRSIPDVRLLHAGRQLERLVGGRPYSAYEGAVLKHASLLAQTAKAPAPTPQPTTEKKPASPPSTDTPAGTIRPEPKDWLPPGVSRIK